MNKEPIKFLIWVYFWLLIFEGALRRWVFTGASDIILVARDPIAILIIIFGFQFLVKETFRIFVISNFVIGIVACFLAMTFGHQDWLVAAYGARLHFLHLPLMFIIPHVLTKDDFWKFAKYTLFLAIPMSALLIAQFVNPPDHWVNIGTGGVGTAGFSGALGKNRPPGTFSFISGTNAFFALVNSFFFSYISDNKKKLPLWAWLTPFCSLLALAFGISRAMIGRFFLGTLSFLIANSIVKKTGSYLIFIFLVITVFLGAFSVLTRNELFNDALSATQYRWENANKGDSGGSDSNLNFFQVVVKRLFVGAVLQAIESSKASGYGIGIMSPVANHRYGESLSEMRNEINESEAYSEAASPWLFAIFEYGPFLGILFILWRAFLFFKIGYLTFKNVLVKKKPIPFVLFGFLGFPIFNGHLNQPTFQGFVVFSAGLILTYLINDEVA